MITAPKCLVNFRFTKDVALEKINDVVEDMKVGSRYTFKLDWRNDKVWIHEYGKRMEKKERSKIIWDDSEASNLKATIEGLRPRSREEAEVDAVRFAAVCTSGSLIEWMIRHAGEYLDEDGNIEKVSVEVF